MYAARNWKKLSIVLVVVTMLTDGRVEKPLHAGNAGDPKAHKVLANILGASGFTFHGGKLLKDTGVAIDDFPILRARPFALFKPVGDMWRLQVKRIAREAGESQVNGTPGVEPPIVLVTGNEDDSKAC